MYVVLNVKKHLNVKCRDPASEVPFNSNSCVGLVLHVLEEKNCVSSV